MVTHRSPNKHSVDIFKADFVKSKGYKVDGKSLPHALVIGLALRMLNHSIKTDQKFVDETWNNYIRDMGVK